jgi:AraC-like DNA-binding protein
MTPRNPASLDPVAGLSAWPEAIATLQRDLPTHGLDPTRVLQDAGLDPDRLTGERPPAAEVFRAYGLSAQAAGDPWFGLRHGASRGAAWLGRYGEAMRGADTLRHALAIAGRYGELLLDGLRVELTVDGPLASLRVHLVEGLDPTGVRVIRQLSVIVAANVIEDMLGRTDVPLTLAFACPPPEAELQAQMRRPWRTLSFQAPGWSLVLPSASLQLRPRGTLAAALAAALADLEAERVQLRTSRSFVARVRLALLAGLPAGPALEGVARELQVSPRTLQSRLADAGTSFQGELDRARLDVARRYLRGTDDPIAWVAACVGFTAAAAFTRFFRAATGVTPRAFRSGGTPA